MASPDSKFSKEEKELIIRLKAKPRRLEPDDPLFTTVLREMAMGTSVGTLEIRPLPPNLKVV